MNLTDQEILELDLFTVLEIPGLLLEDKIFFHFRWTTLVANAASGALVKSLPQHQQETLIRLRMDSPDLQSAAAATSAYYAQIGVDELKWCVQFAVRTKRLFINARHQYSSVEELEKNLRAFLPSAPLNGDEAVLLALIDIGNFIDQIPISEQHKAELGDEILEDLNGEILASLQGVLAPQILSMIEEVMSEYDIWDFGTGFTRNCMDTRTIELVQEYVSDAVWGRLCVLQRECALMAAAQVETS